MGISWVGLRCDEGTARRLLADADELDDMLDSESDDVVGSSLDLDKAWHGVHWLLTGSANPTPQLASDVVCGGAPVGKDRGYGPPRLMTSREVIPLAAFLRGIDLNELRQHFDPAAMAAAEVYPSIWNQPGIADEYLIPSVKALQDFYAAAASAGQTVIQILC